MKEEPAINEELLTRWIDGQTTPEENARMESMCAHQPELAAERQSASALGNLLRQHLPAAQEPPSPEFFNSGIMTEIRRSMPAPAAARSAPRWMEWLRSPWFAPAASAALVAVGFMAWQGRATTTPQAFVSTIYAPDPRVQASTFFSEEAGATVIDLQNLEALPNDREVRAFDIASSEPAAPGSPQILFAAARPEQPVMVLNLDSRETPRISVLQ